MKQMVLIADNAGSESTPSVVHIFWWWLTNDARHQRTLDPARMDELDWLRVVPFIGLHLGCLLVLHVGVSAAAVALAVALYVSRMFFVTAFYHRYFSHKTFKTSRFMQFVLALLGLSCTQKGPLWWAAHHRIHHKHSDGPEDPHSPVAYRRMRDVHLLFLKSARLSQH